MEKDTIAELAKIETRFRKQIELLRTFNFKGEVLLKSGMIIIGARDKNSSSMIRKAFKQAKTSSQGTLTEVRNKNGSAAFVWVSDSLVLSKNKIREIALAA